MCTNRKYGYKAHFYDIKLEKLLLRDDQSLDNVEKPKSLNKMLEYATLLSKEFPFVRIDFYEYKGIPILGEMTFTPASCLGVYNDYGDKYLSELLDIK